MREDYLEHHGILGMRWGVRKASNAYSNASTSSEKKQARTQMSVELAKDSKKLNKLDQKASKMLTKAVKKRYGAFGSQGQYEKYKAKADKKAYKAKKWYDNMSNTYKQQSVVDIPDSDRAIGEKYIKYFKQASDISKQY